MIGCAQPDRPAVWLITWRTAMSALPSAANSGQYVATGAYRSSSPRSASISIARAATVFVVDQTLMIVSSSHGSDSPASRFAVPPHRSTTISPSIVTATDAPSSKMPSSRGVKFASKASAHRLEPVLARP